MLHIVAAFLQLCMKQTPFCSSYDIRAIWWSILKDLFLSFVIFLSYFFNVWRNHIDLEYYRHIIDYHTSILRTPFNSSTKKRGSNLPSLLGGTKKKGNPPPPKNKNKNRTLSHGAQRPTGHEKILYIYYIISLGLLLIFCRNMLG